MKQKIEIYVCIFIAIESMSVFNVKVLKQAGATWCGEKVEFSYMYLYLVH